MRSTVLFALALAVFTCFSDTAPAQGKKGKGPGRLGVFAASIYTVEPNIEVVLGLTDDQREKYSKAVQETILAPALAELAPKKGQPKDKAKLKQFQQESAKARAELKKRTEEILTAEQKATVQKVNAAFASALDSALTKEQKDKLASLKQQPKKKKK